MHLVPSGSTDPEGLGISKDNGAFSERLEGSSSTLPFDRHIALQDVSGPTYVTAQLLVQQTAYALSDRIFTYSPDTFDLDAAVRFWSTRGTLNAYGYPTGLSSMQVRAGAGAVALGYLLSKDLEFGKRHVPQSLIGSSSSLPYLRNVLFRLSTFHAVTSPVVVHVAAIDYVGGGSGSLVTDYSSVLSITDDLGLGVVCSTSPHESQHMALFSTLLSRVLPTIHVYDGVTAGRETTRVIDVLDLKGLSDTFKFVSADASQPEDRSDGPERRLCRLLRVFNGELGTAYGLFEYAGHGSPEHVLIVFGTVESSLSAIVAKNLAQVGHKVGVLNIRVYRPFVEEAFLDALPSSVRNIAVLGQVHSHREVDDISVHSTLYDDVLATVGFSTKWGLPPSVVDVKYAREQIWTLRSMEAVFATFSTKVASAWQSLRNSQPHAVASIHTSDVTTQQYVFWHLDDSPCINAPSAIGELLARDSSSNITVRAVHNGVIRGGIKRTDIRSSNKSIEYSYAIEEADVAYVGDLDLFKDIDILKSVRTNGQLLVKVPGCKDEDLEKKFSPANKRTMLAKNIKLHLLDPHASEAANAEALYEMILTQLAFLKVARPDLYEAALAKVVKVKGDIDFSERIVNSLGSSVREILVTESWLPADVGDESPALPADIKATSFAATEKEVPQQPLLRTWQVAAKGLVFKEAYGTQRALRPDLSVKTWTVHVKENRRLTPITYERNIFHIEFDLGQSGLRYDIGEALGIHGENDENEVMAFIKFYGLDPLEVVEVPSREDPDMLEARTVHQSLMQNIDIFGRPPKKFYEALAEFADDENEKKELLTLASPEGATEFKRRAEVDTITYADILLEFPSAHPSFHDIVRIVSPMKRREYSIASSQQVTPDRVALLVVTVGWVDPRGRDRFGQATRYLAGLRVGDAVTVSVKPSVMKLPSRATEPLIMAGLGTGLAPFRAFVQHRAWQKAQGLEIGAVLLYLGSRHQREEYLYGEEWEAYRDAGVITLLGQAFSRDQPQKIYIQDRMRQTMGDIIQAYLRQAGSFYLCGPTWPVPDVTAVLQEAIGLEAQAAGRPVDARREIERLKDDLRYVLEVY